MISLIKQIADSVYRIGGKGLLRVEPEVCENTLPLRAAYLQMNSWACGAAAAATVVKYFIPDIRPEEVYASIDPDEDGTSDDMMLTTLRGYGLKTISMGNSPDLSLIRSHLRKGRLVVASQNAMDNTCEHFVVIYGCDRDGLYISGCWNNWVSKWHRPYAEFSNNGGYGIYAVDRKTKQRENYNARERKQCIEDRSHKRRISQGGRQHPSDLQGYRRQCHSDIQSRSHHEEACC